MWQDKYSQPLQQGQQTVYSTPVADYSSPVAFSGQSQPPGTLGQIAPGAGHPGFAPGQIIPGYAPGYAPGFAPGFQGLQDQLVSVQSPPDSHMTLSLVSAFICLLPGICAVMASRRSQEAIEKGDVVNARIQGAQAKKLAMTSISLGMFASFIAFGAFFWFNNMFDHEDRKSEIDGWFNHGTDSY